MLISKAIASLLAVIFMILQQSVMAVATFSTFASLSTSGRNQVSAYFDSGYFPLTSTHMSSSFVRQESSILASSLWHSDNSKAKYLTLVQVSLQASFSSDVSSTGLKKSQMSRMSQLASDRYYSTGLSVSWFGSQSKQESPTFAPSKSPTFAPSKSPTYLPTIAPSAVLSAPPSHLTTTPPSENPTFFPSFNSSVSPSALPTFEPNSTAPSFEPSVKPTFSPSNLNPTFIPSISPSFPPSSPPTSVPTTSEEDLWMEIWSEFSTKFARNYSNYYDEILIRDRLGEQGSCKEFISFTTGALYYSYLTEKIDSLALYDVSGIKSSAQEVTCDQTSALNKIVEALTSGSSASVDCDSNKWVVNKCNGTNLMGVCVNCKDPCSIDAICGEDSSFVINPCARGTENICINAGYQSSWGSGHVRSLLFSSSPLAKAPLFSHVSHVVTNSSISALIELDGNGTITCSLYPSDFELPFVDSIILNGVEGEKATSKSELTPFTGHEENGLLYSRIVKFNKIEPSTAYSMYCFTVGELGAKLAYEDVIEPSRKLDFNSDCCKVLEVSTRVKNIRSGSDSLNAVSIFVKNLPRESVTLHLSTICDDGKLCPMIPSTVFIDSHFSEKQIFASISSTSTEIQGKEIVLNISLSGASRNDFSVRYYNDKRSIRLVGDLDSPVAPLISSAIFSNDGSQVLVSFDSNTDQGGSVISNKRSFLCSSLLKFYTKESFSDGPLVETGQNAKCSWKSLNVIIVYSDVLNIGDAIVISGDNILRSECTFKKITDLACNKYNSTSSSSLALTIQQPEVQMIPSVSLIGPAMSSICDVLLLDVSGSMGNGGRAWKSLEVHVVGPSPEVVKNLSDFMNSELYRSKISPPEPIPTVLLQQGNYKFTFTLCNFLNGCGTGSIGTVVVNDVIPTLNIIGPKFRTVTASKGLSLDSSAYTASCSDGSRSHLNLEYAWEIWRLVGTSFTKDESFDSTSKEPKMFKLLPYSLVSDSLYEIRLSVVSTISMRSSLSAVRVFIEPQEIVAIISGGSVVGVKDGGASLLLDASASYDMDRPRDADLSSNFVYAWSCVQTAPILKSSCSGSLNLSSVTGSVLTIHTYPISDAPLSSTGAVVIITVVVSDSNRRSQASTTVVVEDLAAPEVKITTLVTRKYNVDEKVKLSSIVNSPVGVKSICEWSLDDATIDLNDRLLTSISTSFDGVGSWSPFNLALLDFSLDIRSVYNFALTCETSKSARAVVTVVTNGPPLPGLFIVAPDTGFELDTIFSLSASLWQDDDLPITYMFGFINSDDIQQVLKSRGELSYTSTMLPSGGAKNSELDCMVRVFDSYDSDALAVFATQVNERQLLTAELTDFSTNLLASAGSVNDIKAAISLVSSALNKVNCSLAADDFCLSQFNRSPCKTVPNTCGSCLDNFVGRVGPSNSVCVAVSGSESARRSLVGGEVVSKSCPQDCTSSDRGECLHYDIYTALQIPAESCSVESTSCVALCSCVSPYAGSNCYFERDSLEDKASLRSILIENLMSLILNEDASKDTISNQVATLKSLTATSSDEISADSASYLLDISGLILSASKLVGTLVDIHYVFEAIDISINKVGSRLYRILGNDAAIPDSHLDVVAFLAQLSSSLVVEDMVFGQDNIDYIYDNYRISMSVQARRAVNDTILDGYTPIKDSEIGSKINQSIAITVPAYSSVSGGNYVKFAIISIGGDQFYRGKELKNATSNPIMVFLNDANICEGTGDQSCTASMQLVNAFEQSYVTEFNSDALFDVVHCSDTDGISYYVVHECPDVIDVDQSGPLNHDVTVACNGYYDYDVNVTCPYKFREPTCLLRDSFSTAGVFINNACSVKQFGSDFISCDCALEADEFADFSDSSGDLLGSQRMRRLLGSPTSGKTVMIAGGVSGDYYESSVSVVPIVTQTVSFDLSFTLNGLSSSSLSDATRKSVIEAVASVMNVNKASITFKSSEIASLMERASGYHELSVGDRNNFNLQASSFVVNLGVTLSSTDFPNYTNDMTALYSQKSSALTASFNSGSFLTTYNLRANANSGNSATGLSSLSISAPSIIGAPTTSPSPAPTSKKTPEEDSKDFAETDAILWGCVGTVLGLAAVGGMFYSYRMRSKLDKPIHSTDSTPAPKDNANAQGGDIEIGMEGFGIDSTSMLDIGVEISLEEQNRSRTTTTEAVHTPIVKASNSPTYDVDCLTKDNPLVGLFELDTNKSPDLQTPNKVNQSSPHMKPHHAPKNDDEVDLDAAGGLTVHDHAKVQQHGRVSALRVISKVSALYDYNPVNEDELTFKVGDIIDILEHDHENWDIDEGWSLGRRIFDGTHGLFPTNYVKLIDVTAGKADNLTIISNIIAAIGDKNKAPAQEDESFYSMQAPKVLPSIKLPPLNLSNPSSKYLSSGLLGIATPTSSVSVSAPNFKGVKEVASPTASLSLSPNPSPSLHFPTSKLKSAIHAVQFANRLGHRSADLSALSTSPKKTSLASILSSSLSANPPSAATAASPKATGGGHDIKKQLLPVLKVQALFDYVPFHEDELTMKTGDIIELVANDKKKTAEDGESSDEDGWSRGRINGGAVGLFPLNYVKQLPLEINQSDISDSDNAPSNIAATTGDSANANSSDSDSEEAKVRHSKNTADRYRNSVRL